MEKLLTVAIPTYNRAPLLDRQLEWFAEAVQGKENLCELIVSDNCSPDHTPEVIHKWTETLSARGLKVRANRNPRNLGPIRNIAFCINHARTRHVWTVGDDDAIAPHTLRFVLDTLQQQRDLLLLILNFSSRHHETGELNYARCFEIDQDRFAESGKEIVEWALQHPDPTRWGGLVLTTALLYRTAVAQAALRSWPEGLNNLYLQFYVTTYCAIHGKTMLTRDTFLEMAAGRHFFTGNKEMLFRFKMAELPESLVKVAELGYSPALCGEKVTLQREKIKGSTIRRNMVQKPVATLGILRRHRRAVRRLHRFQLKSPALSGKRATTGGPEVAAP